MANAITAPRGSHAAPRWTGWAGFLLGAEYAIGKLVMAARHELGVPFHPAPSSSYAGGPTDVVAAQLANAALGAFSATLALALTLGFGRRLPRAALGLAAFVVLAAQVGSLLVVGASLTGLREDHGQWGADSLVLALASVATWAALLRGALRRPWAAEPPELRSAA